MSAIDKGLSLSERQSIEQACIQLNYAFAHHIDTGQFEGLIALFTEDGIFDRAGLVHHGHDELREGMAQRPPITTRHILTNFYFETVTPDLVTGTVYCITHHAHGVFDGQPLVYGTTHGRMLDMRDEYRQTPDGWRFAKRVAVPVLVPEVWP